MIITTKKGQEIIIDDEDWEKVKDYTWHADKIRNILYARTSTYDGVKQTWITMHRLLMGNPIGMVIDHIDGNGLNNQKSNLRICTNQQNCANSRKRHGASQYKGICWHNDTKKWSAHICSHWHQSFLGYYENEIDAAVAYNIAAKRLFGEFANLNVIEREAV